MSRLYPALQRGEEHTGRSNKLEGRDEGKKYLAD